jgi:hypothetical protein
LRTAGGWCRCTPPVDRQVRQLEPIPPPPFWRTSPRPSRRWCRDDRVCAGLHSLGMADSSGHTVIIGGNPSFVGDPIGHGVTTSALPGPGSTATAGPLGCDLVVPRGYRRPLVFRNGYRGWISRPALTLACIGGRSRPPARHRSHRRPSCHRGAYPTTTSRPARGAQRSNRCERALNAA